MLLNINLTYGKLSKNQHQVFKLVTNLVLLLTSNGGSVLALGSSTRICFLKVILDVKTFWPSISSSPFNLT